MMSWNELRDKGFIPRTNYRQWGVFPRGFELPKSCFNSDWKRLPLYIQVRYTTDQVANSHILKV